MPPSCSVLALWIWGIHHHSPSRWTPWFAHTCFKNENGNHQEYLLHLMGKVSSAPSFTVFLGLCDALSIFCSLSSSVSFKVVFSIHTTRPECQIQPPNLLWDTLSIDNALVHRPRPPHPPASGLPWIGLWSALFARCSTFSYLRKSK